MCGDVKTNAIVPKPRLRGCRPLSCRHQYEVDDCELRAHDYW